tara:strand:+ start:970 stop:1248 length:279 start_codon:yes stop_codon:yes gene_type:complete
MSEQWKNDDGSEGKTVREVSMDAILNDAIADLESFRKQIKSDHDACPPHEGTHRAGYRGAEAQVIAALFVVEFIGATMKVVIGIVKNKDFNS